MTKKELTFMGIALVVLVMLLFLVAHSRNNTNASPVGTTYTNYGTAAVVFTPSTGTATSTSVYNGSGQDRYITNAFVGCGSMGTSLTAYTGTGLASLNFQAATTSTANPAIVTNTNDVMNVTVATTTPDATNATSTYASAFMQRWAAGSYVTFWSNATNTAVCTAGVSYFGS